MGALMPSARQPAACQVATGMCHTYGIIEKNGLGWEGELRTALLSSETQSILHNGWGLGLGARGAHLLHSPRSGVTVWRGQSRTAGGHRAAQTGPARSAAAVQPAAVQQAAVHISGEQQH
jgi:hypothetical protein